MLLFLVVVVVVEKPPPPALLLVLALALVRRITGGLALRMLSRGRRCMVSFRGSFVERFKM